MQSESGSDKFASPPPGASASPVQQPNAPQSANPNGSRKTSQSTAPKATLSCELCRQRKTKCDKAEGGCSSCKRAGVKCVSLVRQRLPRGRNGGRKKADAELKARVGRLENLVRTLEASGASISGSGSDSPAKSNDAYIDQMLSGAQSPAPQRASSISSGEGTSSGNSISRYIGSSFWTSLTNEVSSLREILDDPSDDEEEEESMKETSSSDPLSSSNATNFSFVLCDSNSLVVSPDALQHPPKFMIVGLCQIYIKNVDPMFKILHKPTLSAWLIDGKQYLDYPPGHVATESLAFSIYFAAVATLNEEQCLQNFGESKQSLMEKYRFGLRAALSRADFVNTDDISVLQALMLLLVCSRTIDVGRSTWTLISLAVRIGVAMRLNEDDSNMKLSPFQVEMRHRAWYALLVMDLQGCYDRASEPVTDFRHYNSAQPLNINDADISPEQTEPVVERDGPTDITFFLIVVSAWRPVRLLNFVAPGDYEREPTEIEQDYDKRRALALAWRRSVEERFANKCDEKYPPQKAAKYLCTVIGLNMEIMAARPMKRHPKCTPPVFSGDFFLNKLCDFVEFGLYVNKSMHEHGYDWFGRMYNQWHPLAVMLAELCTHTEGDAVERAWRVVDALIERVSVNVADTEKGMLWRPIEKLLKRARGIRAQTLVARSSDVSAADPNQLAPLPSKKRAEGMEAMWPTQKMQRMGINMFPNNDDPMNGVTPTVAPNENSSNGDWNSWQLPYDPLSGAGFMDSTAMSNSNPGWANLDELVPGDWLSGMGPMPSYDAFWQTNSADNM